MTPEDHFLADFVRFVRTPAVVVVDILRVFGIVVQIRPVIEQFHDLAFDALHDVGGHFFPDREDVVRAEIVVNQFGNAVVIFVLHRSG